MLKACFTKCNHDVDVVRMERGTQSVSFENQDSIQELKYQGIKINENLSAETHIIFTVNE